MLTQIRRAVPRPFLALTLALVLAGAIVPAASAQRPLGPDLPVEAIAEVGPVGPSAGGGPVRGPGGIAAPRPHLAEVLDAPRPMLLVDGVDLLVIEVAPGYDQGGWHIRAVVRNGGMEPAGGYVVSTGWASQQVNGLAPGASSAVRFPTSDCPSGSGTVFADANNRVRESNETNNSQPYVIIC